MSVIAVFSGTYCGARDIAQKVAERLDYTSLADDLLDRAAGASGWPPDKLAKALTTARGLLDSITGDPEKALVHVKVALARAISEDNLVYLGPAAHLIPRSIGHVLHVALVADQDFRVQRASEQGVDATEASRTIKKTDQELAQWTHQIAEKGPWDEELYDLKISVAAEGIDGAVDLICNNIIKGALRPTDRSIQATLDFLLATQVSLQLLERGRHECEVTAEKGKVTVIVTMAPQRGAIARTIYGLRYEGMEEEIREVCANLEGVTEVVIRPGAPPRRTRALLVDDEQEYVTTLSERLEIRDIETDVVYDGEQALSRVDEDEPLVMVLDLKMPGIDGIEVLRQVKRDHPNIEVIVVTGHGSEEDERVVRDLGAFDYLNKPVDIALLAERMSAASDKALARQTSEEDDGQS